MLTRYKVVPLVSFTSELSGEATPATVRRRGAVSTAPLSTCRQVNEVTPVEGNRWRTLTTAVSRIRTMILLVIVMLFAAASPVPHRVASEFSIHKLLMKMDPCDRNVNKSLHSCLQNTNVCFSFTTDSSLYHLKSRSLQIKSYTLQLSYSLYIYKKNQLLT